MALEIENDIRMYIFFKNVCILDGCVHKRDRNNIPITSMNEAIKEDLLKRGTFIFLQRSNPQRLREANNQKDISIVL